MREFITERLRAQRFSAPRNGLVYELKPLKDSDSADREARIARYAQQIHAGKTTASTFNFRNAGLARPIQCTTPGHERVFDSVGLAATALSLRAANIRQAIRNGGATAGLRFRYIPEAPARRISRPNWRKVICITNDREFDSISDAARANGLAISTLYDGLKHGRPIRGMCYRYAESIKAAA